MNPPVIYTRCWNAISLRRPLVRSLRRLLVTTGLSTLIGGGAAEGQVLIHAPDASLACFEDWHGAGRVGLSQCEGGAVSVETLMSRWDEFPTATIEAVLDGLERLSLTSDNKRVRITAAVSLTAPGTKIDDSQPTMPGIVDRAIRVYQVSADPAVEHTIVSTMPSQAERMQAMAFLKDVARQDRPQDRGSEWPLPFAAVTLLADMGAEGLAALQQLRASGEVHNPSARGYLQNIPKQSFRDPAAETQP